MSGFRAFILRGNLVEIAVAFIIGLAFAAVVTSFTDMLMGFIGKAGGQPDFSSVTLAEVNVGIFINALISFLIIAAVVYFLVVVPYNKLQERRARGQEEAPTPPAEDVALLTEIRDLLANGTRPTSGTGI